MEASGVVEKQSGDAHQEQGSHHGGQAQSRGVILPPSQPPPAEHGRAADEQQVQAAASGEAEAEAPQPEAPQVRSLGERPRREQIEPREDEAVAGRDRDLVHRRPAEDELRDVAEREPDDRHDFQPRGRRGEEAPKQEAEQQNGENETDEREEEDREEKCVTLEP